MDFENIQAIEPENLKSIIQNLSPEKLAPASSKMTEAQIKSLIFWIDQKNDPQWKEKIQAVVLEVDKRPLLEAMGSALSLGQITHLLNNTFQKKPDQHIKLAPLLMNLRFETFAEYLFKATESQLIELQHEGITEPIQYQLNLLCHELAKQLEQIEEDIEEFCEDIAYLDVELLDRKDVLELLAEIQAFGKFFENIFEKANKALAIAWNTNRSDLIETLNKIKKGSQKYNVYGIGTPRKGNQDPTGLYSEFEDILFEKLGDPTDLEDREALRHEESAIEGLAKFSVWDLEDYFEAGLLNSIKNKKELKSNRTKTDHKQRMVAEEKYFIEIQKNLESLGLKTILDLKIALVFSKLSLKQFVNIHREKLNHPRQT